MTRRVATVDDYPRIDIRDMKRQGMLEPGESGSLSWSCRGSIVDSIGYESHPDRLVLIRHSERTAIRFDSTACYFGGERRWFLCPGCHRRIAVLCSARGVFLCRHCHHLPYLSQSQSKLRRLISRRQHIASRIFEDGDGRRRRKRKGLHLRTFQRELAGYLSIQDQINGLSINRIERLGLATRGYQSR